MSAGQGSRVQRTWRLSPLGATRSAAWLTTRPAWLNGAENAESKLQHGEITPPMTNIAMNAGSLAAIVSRRHAGAARPDTQNDGEFRTSPSWRREPAILGLFVIGHPSDICDRSGLCSLLARCSWARPGSRQRGL